MSRQSVGTTAGGATACLGPVAMELGMSGVFVSYRREPSTASAGRIADRLRAHFGKSRVFMDVTDIPPGAAFPSEIEDRIRASKAFLAVIGPGWASARDDQGRRKLWRSDDWVRKEIAAALRGSGRVIPVLVDRAQMPAAADLPKDIRKLVERNAIELSPAGFLSDIPRLIAALERAGMRKTLLKKIGVWRGLLASGVVAALVLLVGLRMADAAEQRRLRGDATGPVTQLAGLYWERFEVTNARYAACVAAGRCDEPGLAPSRQRFDLPDRSALPVVGVRAEQAAGFCAWTGRRLPTRSEWQAAATRGGTSRWPWGDEDPDANRVNAVFVLSNSGSGSSLDAATKDRIDKLAARDTVTSEELADLAPDVPPAELDEVANDWPLMSVAERTALLTQILADDSPPMTEVITPDDVVAVDGVRSGATAPSDGVHHLVGNAAEWSSTTRDGETWDGHSATALWVVGGSFGDDIESLPEGLVVDSDTAVDTIGFRCVKDG